MNFNYGFVVFIFICADYLTGLIKALKNGDWKSARMKDGLFSKLGEVCSMVLMYLLEYVLPFINVQIGIPFVQALGIYLVIMELGSIIENLGAINPMIADKLNHIFEDFKKGVD